MTLLYTNNEGARLWGHGRSITVTLQRVRLFLFLGIRDRDQVVSDLLFQNHPLVWIRPPAWFVLQSTWILGKTELDSDLGNLWYQRFPFVSSGNPDWSAVICFVYSLDPFFRKDLHELCLFLLFHFIRHRDSLCVLKKNIGFFLWQGVGAFIRFQSLFLQKLRDLIRTQIAQNSFSGINPPSRKYVPLRKWTRSSCMGRLSAIFFNLSTSTSFLTRFERLDLI